MPQWEEDATIEDVSVQDISDGLVLLDKHHIFETVKRIAKRATHLSIDRLCAMQERVFRELSSLKIALLVVDFQNDFISGSLRVQDGSAAEDPLRTIPLLNRMLDDYPFDMVVFTQDWHPENHISFIGAAGDPDRKFMHNYRVRDLEPFDRVAFKVPSTVQILYPAHCVQGSWGAKIHESISIPADAEFVKKGTNVLVDSYSAFRDNSGHKINDLEDLLKSNGITAVLGCGLAFDICVRHTVVDANNLGFLAGVIRDCSQGFSQENIKETCRVLDSENIAIVDVWKARSIIERHKVPVEWICRLMDLIDDESL